MVVIRQWEMRAPREPFVASERRVESLAAGDALVRVAACGVCHTDLGFHSGDVRTNHALPLVLGHEVSGVVEGAGSAARPWLGKAVVVPAVLPCGECAACRRGRYAICARQIFPGNDVHGGFASHVVVPARFLCDAGDAAAEPLQALSVVADAVSTALEAVARSELAAGELAVFVGVGGVGGFGAQIAAARGATVVAIEPSPERRRLALAHGAAAAFDPRETDASALRKTLREFARERSLPPEEWKLFETSGTTAGQETAFALLSRGAHLGIVGFTRGKVTVPLSHLMALDARAVGNWGCDPTRFAEALALVASGRVAVEPFIERRPLSQIDAVFADMAAHRLARRAVLVPDFAAGGSA
jgi:6-hydroxycyclohex-1-ene-1-carbonyl-CoA dehydrogenase